MLHEIIDSDDESQLEYTEPTYPEQQTLPSNPQNNEKIAKDEDALKDDQVQEGKKEVVGGDGEESQIEGKDAEKEQKEDEGAQGNQNQSDSNDG